MRIRHVDNMKEAERLVDDYITQGYKVESQGENSIKVKKSEYGSIMAHILIFILTVWWTFFLGNVIYAVVKYLTGEQVLIKVGRE